VWDNRVEATSMDREHPGYHERIVRDTEILGGKPVVKGTRIPVELVLAKLARNPDLAELFADYPRLSLDDVRACQEYALAESRAALGRLVQITEELGLYEKHG
jgi:uncharacterized protein (DUF433 family)